MEQADTRSYELCSMHLHQQMPAFLAFLHAMNEASSKTEIGPDIHTIFRVIA